MMNDSPGHLMPKMMKSVSDDALFLCPETGGMSLAQAHRGLNSGVSPLSDSERDRLVKASKSRTVEETLDLMKKKADFFCDYHRISHNHQWMLKTGEVEGPARFTEYEPGQQVTPHGSPGCRAVIEFKEWADEWRLRTEVDGQNLQPPEQAGHRISDMLSHRGASKIAESCAFMAVKKGGYKTFVTGTFTEIVREKIASGETTIQKEVSRTMNSLQKMYQRGWISKTGERIDGHPEGLPYCWVVEVPKNAQGEDNPHIHMLLGWRVEYKHFEEWAARIEKIWGNGYFHLEKIKDSTCAGAYMAKAAGYLSKAQNSDTQGEVKGNRYGISAVARAPGWLTYAKTQLHNASQLIVDVYDHLTQKYGEQYQERRKLNNTLSKIPKDKKAIRQRLGKKLAQVRNELNRLPVRCNRYQIVCKGRAHAFRFFNWCLNEEDQGNDWLPEKEPGMAWKPGEPPKAKDSLYFHKLYQLIGKRKLWRRLRNIPAWVGWTNTEWHQVKGGYEQQQANVKEPETTEGHWQEYQQQPITSFPEKPLDTLPEPPGSVWREYIDLFNPFQQPQGVYL